MILCEAQNQEPQQPLATLKLNRSSFFDVPLRLLPQVVYF